MGKTMMMKRTRRFMGGLALTASLMLQAGTVTAGEIYWSDMKADLVESGIEGDFTPVSELGLKMWIPDGMEEAELDEDMEAAGYLRYYTSSDGTGTAAVTYVDLDGIGLAEYEALVEEAGGTGMEEINLNGLGAITYELEESDLKAVAFVTEKGYVLEFLFSPLSDEDYAEEVRYMAASIMSAE